MMTKNAVYRMIHNKMNTKSIQQLEKDLLVYIVPWKDTDIPV
jgi:hypothetical protein